MDFKNWDEFDKIYEEAFKLRGEAGVNPDKTEDLLKAYDLFGRVLEYYDSLGNYWTDISTVKMNTTFANKEYISYERELVMFIYKIRKYEDLEAKKYLEKSTKYINKAIEILKDVINSGNLDENMINDFKYDLKKWEYLSKQNNYLMNTTMARCYIDTDISKALDYYEKSVDTGEDFINLTKEYQEYIDINSIRIVQANYYKNKSDYYFLLGNKIIQEYSEDKEGNILLRAIEIMWGAYIDNIKAMEKRPEDKWVKEVADSQLEFLDKILINNKFIMKKAIYTNNKELKYHIESLKINNKDKKIIKGFVYRVVDSLILNPNFHGFGIDIKKLFSSRNK